MRNLIWIVAAFIVLVPAIARSQAQTFNVSVAFPSYLVNGATDPSLQLTRGQTYAFSLDSSVSAHPFHIKTAAVTSGSPGSINDYNSGVTNNGTGGDTLTFVVPSDAPSSLVYQCGIHTFMTGPIQIVSPAPPVPAMGSLATTLLVLALGGGALFVSRRRRLAVG
jgi:hypothetical protein